MAYEMLGHRFTVEEWESICTRCGLCCYEKYEDRGRIVFTNTPCRYLNQDNGCKVYHKRTQVCNDCHDVVPEVVLKGELLPETCSYVQLAARLEQIAPGDIDQRERSIRRIHRRKGELAQEQLRRESRGVSLTTRLKQRIFGV